MNLRKEICEIWRNKRNVREKYKLSLTEPRNKCFGQSLIPWTHHHNQPEKNQQWTSQPQWTPSQRSRWKEFVGNQISPLKDSLESKQLATIGNKTKQNVLKNRIDQLELREIQLFTRKSAKEGWRDI